MTVQAMSEQPEGQVPEESQTQKPVLSDEFDGQDHRLELKEAQVPALVGPVSMLN